MAGAGCVGQFVGTANTLLGMLPAALKSSSKSTTKSSAGNFNQNRTGRWYASEIDVSKQTNFPHGVFLAKGETHTSHCLLLLVVNLGGLFPAREGNPVRAIVHFRRAASGCRTWGV